MRPEIDSDVFKEIENQKKEEQWVEEDATRTNGCVGKKESFFYTRDYGLVEISFVNGIFYRVAYDMVAPYTREEWQELAWINAEIKRLEKLIG